MSSPRTAPYSLSNWPIYQNRQIVRALPITGITPDGIVLVGARHEPFHPSELADVAHAVINADGSKSVSPKAAFAESHTRV